MTAYFFFVILNSEAQMTAVPIFDVKNRLPYFIHLAESGETVQITRHGKPVARIISEEEFSRNQKSDEQVFMDKLMSWREKNKDWLHDEDVQNAFNIPRTVEPALRHPEDFDFGE